MSETRGSAPSLDQLRDLIHNQQTRESGTPQEPARQVRVTRDGRLTTGDQAGNQPSSDVQPDTFAYPNKASDARYVVTHMPEGTQLAESNGREGWLYSFTNEFGEPFTMFAYFDAGYYQVLVLEPELEEYWLSPHTGHIYSDGLICFGNDYNSGRPTLETAYAKSVLWANGISVALQGYDFPWNVDQ